MSTSARKETGQAPLSNQPGKMTALQKHVAFFDRDNDGIIWPIDTYVGCRELKINIFLSILNAFVVHLALSYLTWDHIIPDPFFRIRVDRIHKAKHGSDSEAYTHKGDFDNNRFDYFFDMYSDPPHTHLTTRQLFNLSRGNLNPYDPFGWISQFGEWVAAYVVLRNRDPRGIAREDLRAVYNGSMFYEISGKNPPKRD